MQRTLTTPTNRINLGCPIDCPDYTCVDANPEPSSKHVINADALGYLASNPNTFDEIYSKNLLEHLTNVGSFFALARDSLKPFGRLTVITDNAEFLPFYFPFIHRFGFGAHSSNKYIGNYKYRHCNNHFALFTKMHLENYLSQNGFMILKIRRTTFGARLKAVAIKP